MTTLDDRRLDAEIAAFLASQAADVAGAPTTGEMTERVRRGVRTGLPTLGVGIMRPRAVLVLVLVGLCLLYAMAMIGGGARPPLAGPAGNGWLAIATQPGYRQTFDTDWATGGDIYLAKPGGEPLLIAGRGDDGARNVCPTFSPDGSMLAYGHDSLGASVILLRVAEDGTVQSLRRIPLPMSVIDAPCPRWSDDGRRLAWLDNLRDRNGAPSIDAATVSVVTLDGTPVEWTIGDPTVDELAASGAFDPVRAADGTGPLLSPDGGSRAICDAGWLIVGPADGSADRRVGDLCGYSLAAWSPDGTRILLFHDVGGAFAATLVDPDGVDPPVELGQFPINGARSFPGRGDVSWQSLRP
ncbi:MAG TPA: hypothetical protein VFY23_05655 [Candidatus Limnocylindrales bacterium]|nr:hypothetical protein [Candidatus Limnocylindrales bacterium]